MLITAHDLAASPDYEWVESFRLVGGTSEYDEAEYPTGRAQKVRVAYVTGTPALHVVKRYVEPEAQIEPVSVSEEYPTWGPGYALWSAYLAEEGRGPRAVKRDMGAERP